MTHLIRLGHREIAHLTVSPLQMPYQDRLNGYISALEEHKIPVDKDGKAVAEKEIRTAGVPHHIELVADRTSLTANGKDLSYVTVKVVDKDGNLCPNANQLVKFKVKGAGMYRAGANGDPVSLELFHLPQMTLFNGMLTAIIQTTDKAGNIILEASAKGVKNGQITLQSK